MYTFSFLVVGLVFPFRVFVVSYRCCFVVLYVAVSYTETLGQMSTQFEGQISLAAASYEHILTFDRLISRTNKHPIWRKFEDRLYLIDYTRQRSLFVLQIEWTFVREGFCKLICILTNVASCHLHSTTSSLYCNTPDVSSCCSFERRRPIYKLF
jgi:hypothetical protein